MTANRSIDESDIVFRDAPEEGAFVVDAAGMRVGKAEYRIRDARHVFFHTEVDDTFEGLGIGTRLVHFALETVRSNGGKVVPLCPFFASYIRRHPDYEDLVDHEMTMRMKAPRS